MSQPISLTDSELTAVMDAARPLQPRDRDRFLRAVARAIAELPEIGPGSVHRAIASVWRQHYDAPDLRIGEGKYR
jgi:predicted DNA-binding transcriptional regulator YafY